MTEFDVASVQAGKSPGYETPALELNVVVENGGSHPLLLFDARFEVLYLKRPSSETLPLGVVTASPDIATGRSQLSVRSGGSAVEMDALLQINRSCNFRSTLEIAPWKFGEIMTSLEKVPPGQRAVKFYVKANFLYQRYPARTPSNEVPRPANVRSEHEVDIPESTWYGWARDWGKRVEWMYLPSSLGQRLRKLREELGVSSEWEVVSELVEARKVGEVENLLVHGSGLKETIKKVLNRTQTELLIAAVAVDTTIVDHISQVRTRGADVRLVIRPLKNLLGPRKRERRTIATAIQRLLEAGVLIREHPDAHARFIVSDGSAVVGSTDLDNYGLNVHRNASVFTRDPTVVDGLKLFFEEVWEESENIPTKSGA